MDSTGFSYDLNGNLTDDGVYDYYYDSENRLIEVSYSGSAIAGYYYDYAGRRIAKVAGGITTTYCYDGAQVIAEYEKGRLFGSKGCMIKTARALLLESSLRQRGSPKKSCLTLIFFFSFQPPT